MADVDDEFLALVGGDDASDEEGEGSGQSRQGSESPGPEARQNKGTPTATSRRGRSDQTDEEEEGEASSIASPASDASAPMDESDSESDSFPVSHNANPKMEDEGELKYPVEGIYASEAEKDEISAMPELEREQLIAKRQEEINRERQNTLLRRLLQRNKQESSQSVKKRKAGTAELEDGQRKTSRQRTKIGGSKVGETSAGIAELRRVRAEKQRARARKEDLDRTKGKRSTQDNGHDDDDAHSDVEWASNYGRKPSKSPTPEKRDAPPAELRDFERVRLSRSRFAEVCFYPGFDDAIAGCYCRVAIGPSRDTGEPEYQMGVIKGFTQGRPYAMQKMNQSFVTDQYVKIAFGKTVKEYPFISCSDSPFNETECQRYHRVCQDDGMPFPKKTQVDAKIDDINSLRNRIWTEKEVSDRLARIQNMKKKYDSSERNRLLNKLEEAKERGDEARITELQGQLDKLEVPKLAFRTSLLANKKSAPPSAPSQQDRLAQLNMQRRRDNAETVRRAQIMERAQIRKVETRAPKGEEGEEGEEREGDTPRRLKARPKSTNEGKDSDGSETPTAVHETPKASVTGLSPLPPHMQKLQMQQHQAGKDKKGVPQIHRPLVADDIIASLDLEIDVEID
ncbi:putative RNA polymerase 2 transcription elongation factor protein [Rosellinia necatrix]|uniref:Putative RNA polymerase 2 transcription elongation factor protein n=1 Tax=Rosellinia necatrix TaxID=77044 RepID=A0A1W2TD28_ROSNE|nr:putative RNA polymerase 2 transcription elongation factor protein [Rosellinia necatrix]